MAIVSSKSDGERTLFAKDGDGFERIVAGEMLIPYVKDVFGDIYTPEEIRKFSYRFMVAGINAGFEKSGGSIGLDVDHDNVDATGKFFIVESYIAKAGDPDFKEGSWVIVSWIPDDELWQRVMDNDIVGYSYEAFTRSTEVFLEGDFDVYAVGETEPDITDGHTHTYFCILDDNGRVIYGGTGASMGHSHEITRHSNTEDSFMHTHRFNLTRAR